MPITRTIYTCIVEVDSSHSSNYTQIMQLMYSVADIVYTEDTWLICTYFYSSLLFTNNQLQRQAKPYSHQKIPIVRLVAKAGPGSGFLGPCVLPGSSALVSEWLIALYELYN